MDYITYYNEYKDKIFSYFYYHVNKDTQIAEDLTSDTFLKGFEKIDTYNDDFAFSTWIFTIARNTLYDYYKTNKINVSIDNWNDWDLSLDEFIKYEQDFHKKITDEQKVQQIYEKIEKMPHPQKDIFIMKYLEDFSHKEIANITWKSEANIRKILSRGIALIKQAIIPLYE